jgi:hypothetical protein
MPRSLSICGLICVALYWAAVSFAQEIRVPATVVAGEDASISTTGSGKATFYLQGPGVSRKSEEVSLGEEISLSSNELQRAGSYLAIVCSDSCRSGAFFVTPAKPASLSFLVHPTRVTVSLGDAVSGVAFPFDQFHNFVLASGAINFQLTAGNASLLTREVRTQNGAAWFRTTSGKAAGPLQVIATMGDVSARRVVQQVAAEACNLRIQGHPSPGGIFVETAPVHDCAGNSLPDGTVVTFTAAAADGKSTVDAPIKQGIARAQMAASGATVVSAASGVVMGNELHLEAQQ